MVDGEVSSLYPEGSFLVKKDCFKGVKLFLLLNFGFRKRSKGVNHIKLIFIADWKSYFVHFFCFWRTEQILEVGMQGLLNFIIFQFDLNWVPI